MTARSEWNRELRLWLCAWCRQPVSEGQGVYHAGFRILTHQGECKQNVAQYEVAYDRSSRGRNRTPREVRALIAANRPPTIAERCGSAPFSAQLTEQEKQNYYSAQLFNPDGTPNLQGRALTIKQIGSEAFASVYKAVVQAWVQQYRCRLTDDSLGK